VDKPVNEAGQTLKTQVMITTIDVCLFIVHSPSSLKINALQNSSNLSSQVAFPSSDVDRQAVHP
jgi:hypothetical protein